MKNDYKILGDTTEIYCDYKGEKHTILVDTDDLHSISTQLGKIGIINNRSKKGTLDMLYAEANLLGKGRRVTLHRFILGFPVDLIVDHIDGNTLRNLKSNLRATTKTVNSRNRNCGAKSNTGHVGVSLYKGRYKAYIKVCDKRIHLGSFTSLDDAIKARKQAEIDYWGDER